MQRINKFHACMEWNIYNILGSETKNKRKLN